MKYTRLALLLSMLAAISAAAHSGGGGVSSVDSLYFFYQRTIYLESLCQEGTWWANPARISSIDKTTLITVNTGLLGGKYSISSVRVILRPAPAINAGFGITGTSASEGRSFSGSPEGAKMTSNFKFSRPSFEAAVSFVSPLGGTLGVLLATGTESYVPEYDKNDRVTFFFVGINPGYLTPPLLNTIRFSFSTLSVRHLQFESWWDNCAKAGVLLNVKDGAALASLEYGFSLDGDISFFGNLERFHGYEVVKGDLSVRFRRIAGAIIGYSRDTYNFRDNGSTFHGGVELRRSAVYPYYGGYELGVSLFASRNHSASLIHRFWIGYSFNKDH